MSEQLINTVIGEEIDVTVFYEFQPEEPPEHPGSGFGGYPGCPADVTINAVAVDGDESNDILSVLSDDVVKELEAECLEYACQPPDEA